MSIIGILGRKRVGKDTTADHLVNKHNYTKLSLATPLKETCMTLFNLSEQDMINKDEIHEKWGVSPRTLLKYIGTDILRKDINKILPDIKDNFWIKLCMDKCDTIPHPIVISDVRFQNEIDHIKQKGGIIIKIINDNAIKEDDENQIDNLKGDYTIINETSYEHLYETLNNIIKNIKSM